MRTRERGRSRETALEIMRGRFQQRKAVGMYHQPRLCRFAAMPAAEKAAAADSMARRLTR